MKHGFSDRRSSDDNNMGQMSGVRKRQCWDKIDANDVGNMGKHVTGSRGGKDL